MPKIIDPNAKSASVGIFGLPYNRNESKVVYLPVQWDVTTSYGHGTHKGPQSILKASAQIDLYDIEYGNTYEHGLFLEKSDKKIATLNKNARILAEKIIDSDDETVAKSKTLQTVLAKVNIASDALNQYVYEETKKTLQENKFSVLIGGDHSTPFGAIKAYAEKHKNLSILHFDAHSDTRVAYMGFKHSHASILHNVAEKIKGIKKIVQVGIRDFCEQEFNYTKTNKLFKVYFDQEIQERKIKGEAFAKIAKEIVSNLSSEVYITFDIDGLDPRYCPNTGTPVPGGLEYSELTYIVKEILSQKKKLVGFDIVEVAPNPKNTDEWDANVGMRLLYKLTGAMLKS